MICLLLYWYWLLWDLTQAVQETRAIFCFMSTMELGAELIALVIWLLSRKGVLF